MIGGGSPTFHWNPVVFRTPRTTVKYGFWQSLGRIIVVPAGVVQPPGWVNEAARNASENQGLLVYAGSVSRDMFRQ